jgi:glycerol-3-phosphate dehydrogenase (NAD+)
LTDVINRTHENKRYLPDIKLPKNLVATAHLRDVVKDATLIVVCVPHQVCPLTLLAWTSRSSQFLHTVLSDLIRYEAVHPGARAITAIKGVEVNGTDIETFASLITDKLEIPTSALSGANIALEGKHFSPRASDFKLTSQLQRTNSVKLPSEHHHLKIPNFGKQYSMPQHSKCQS